MNISFQNFKLLNILIIALALVSCSTKSHEFSISKPETVEGKLKGYIDIVDQPYKLEFEKGGGIPGNDLQAIVNIKFKIIRHVDFEISSGYNKGINIDLKFLDESGLEPISESFGLAGKEQDEFESYLKSGNGEKIFKMRGPQMISSESSFINKSDWSKVKFIKIFSSVKN